MNLASVQLEPGFWEKLSGATKQMSKQRPEDLLSLF